MSYGLHVSKVVVGVLVALGSYHLTGAADRFGTWLFATVVLAGGLFVAFHGLFTGIEAAVSAGRVAEDGPASSE